MEGIKEWLMIIKEHFSEWTGLFAGFMLITLIFAGIGTGIVPDGYRDAITCLWIIVCVVWIVIWAVLTEKIPRAKCGTIGIIVAVETEESRQRLLIEKDLCVLLSKLFLERDCLINFSIIHLSNKKSRTISEIINDYFLNDFHRKNSDKVFKKREKRWTRVQRKSNARLFIFGSVKKRLDREEKYFVNLDAVITHGAVEIKQQLSFQRDFKAVFPREQIFSVNEEVKGIKELSERLYIVTRFSAGVAALFTLDPYTAYELHKGLRSEIEKFDYINDQKITLIHKQINSVIAAEQFLIASDHFYNHKNYKVALEWLDKSLPMLINNYRVLLTKAYLEFIVRRDPKESLRWLLRSRKVAGHDLLWLYNKAFIYIYMGNIKSALRDYDALSQRSCDGEERIASDCIEFNANLMTQEPDKIQSHFVIAFLFQHKIRDLRRAEEHYKLFIEKARKFPVLSQLCDRAISQINQINRKG